jgi:hypothetical protein
MPNTGSTVVGAARAVSYILCLRPLSPEQGILHNTRSATPARRVRYHRSGAAVRIAPWHRMAA